MLNREMVQKTEAFLKQTFDASPYLNEHPAAKAYRLEHTYRVANIGRLIAQKEGFDETEAVIACLLHDIAYCEELTDDNWQDHGRRSARITRPFLAQLGLSEDRISDICYGIAIHVDDKADFDGERTPFALSVADADNIDRFDAYRIHETLFHDGFLDMELAKKKELIQKRLRWLKEMMDSPTGTKTAGKLWRARLAFYLSFYEKLLSQLEHSESLCD